MGALNRRCTCIKYYHFQPHIFGKLFSIIKIKKKEHCSNFNITQSTQFTIFRGEGWGAYSRLGAYSNRYYSLKIVNLSKLYFYEHKL